MPGSTLVANDLAWLLATHPDAQVRDGAAAVAVAEETQRASAAERAGKEDAGLLDTLAAAYAEAGRYAEAVAAEVKAERQAAVMAAMASRGPNHR